MLQDSVPQVENTYKQYTQGTTYQTLPDGKIKGSIESHTRRLLGAKQMPDPKAAGQLCSWQYHGGVTPLKGRGVPPADNKGGSYVGQLKKWHPQNSHILNIRDVIAHSNTPQPSFKLQKRYNIDSIVGDKTYQLNGGSVRVEGPIPRYAKRLGTGIPPKAATIPTDVRVMGMGEGISQDDVNPSFRKRPHSAFSKRYHIKEAPKDHPDVIFYSYSLDTPSLTQKMDTSRSDYNWPQTCLFDASKSQSIKQQCNYDFQFNKLKGTHGSVVL